MNASAPQVTVKKTLYVWMSMNVKTNAMSAIPMRTAKTHRVPIHANAKKVSAEMATHVMTLMNARTAFAQITLLAQIHSVPFNANASPDSLAMD